MDGSVHMTEQDIRAEMAYHDYAVLIAHIEGERFFCDHDINRESFENFTKSNDNLTRECARYRNRILEWLGQFREANEIKDGTPFDDFLFNPACFIAFGDNDNISVVATDDFETVEKLPLVEGVAIRQTCLAFCRAGSHDILPTLLRRPRRYHSPWVGVG